MIDFVRGQALKRGLDVLVLHVGLRNIRALKCYLKYGFEVTGRTKDLWEMRKEIS